MATEQSVMVVIRASRPTFKKPHDKVVFAVHASFLASGYVLKAVGPAAFADDALTSTLKDEVGIERWNEFEDNYALFYSHPEKGSKVLVKFLAMNDKLLVDALDEGSSDPIHLEINVGDYVGENGVANYDSQFKDLGKLVSIVDKDVLSKLSGPSTANPSIQYPISETIELRETELQGPQTFHPSGVAVPPVYPAVGGSDLLPGPGAGIYTIRGGFGGMLVGPNDPRFFGGVDGEPVFPVGQPGVPPCARFDPYAPLGVPAFEPNPFVRNPHGRGTHPDLEPLGDDSAFI